MGSGWSRVPALGLVAGLGIAMFLLMGRAATNDPGSPTGALTIATQTDPIEADVAAPGDGGHTVEGTSVEAPSGDCRTLLRTPSKITPWNPAGPKLIGLQAGHWLTREAPEELARLRTQTGTSGGGYTEWGVNLDIAQRTAALLSGVGVEAAVLATTLPPCYRAHAFVAIHADGDVSGLLRGFKVARAGASSIPSADDALVAALNEQYASATGFARQDNQISRRMLNYYAFNYRRQLHTIAPDTPSAIIETGFLTNAADRFFLTNRADQVAKGIANGVLQYLGLDARIPI